MLDSGNLARNARGVKARTRNQMCVGWEGREMTQNYSDQRKASWDLFKNGTVLRRVCLTSLGCLLVLRYLPLREVEDDRHR